MELGRSRSVDVAVKHACGRAPIQGSRIRSCLPACLPASFQGVVLVADCRQPHRAIDAFFPGGAVVVGADQISRCITSSDRQSFSSSVIMLRRHTITRRCLEYPEFPTRMALAKAQGWS